MDTIASGGRVCCFCGQSVHGEDCHLILVLCAECEKLVSCHVEFVLVFA